MQAPSIFSQSYSNFVAHLLLQNEAITLCPRICSGDQDRYRRLILPAVTAANGALRVAQDASDTLTDQFMKSNFGLKLGFRIPSMKVQAQGDHSEW